MACDLAEKMCSTFKWSELCRLHSVLFELCKRGRAGMTGCADGIDPRGRQQQEVVETFGGTFF